VNWQVASFVVLGLVIVGGFAWFERSRPPARLVGLVAALAALAVAGRVLLAPIPNVVATTDIVLFTGYAIGGAPGFAVGALSAVISNFWLGQGPWTPWQMAGWGLVGLGGAGLAFVTGRRLGRVGLAVACGVAGLAYGALLDFSVMATYGGEQSLDRYLALSARGIPFNIAHAVGNVTLALIAGPALVRMLTRFRSRTEFIWHGATARPLAPAAPAPGHRGGPAAIAVLAVLLVAGSLLVATQPARGDGAADAASWLSRAQNSDGGFGASPSDPSSPEITGWAMLGLEAAGRNPLDVRRKGRSAVDYLSKNAGDISGIGDIERTILALRGAGVSVRDFSGRDLVKKLLRRQSDDGSFGGEVNLTAFGVLALEAAGESGSAVNAASKWLRSHQNTDGGWGFHPGAASDPDSTGAVIQALAAGGGGVKGGVDYLRAAQESDGGWSLVETGAGNSQSTAWAVQGLLAAGVDPAGVKKNGHNGLEFLAARQQGDGHYKYSKGSDQTPVWVTGQAILAVASKPFPLSPVAQSTGDNASSGNGSAPGFPSPAPAPTSPSPSAGAPGSFPSIGGAGGFGDLGGVGGGGGGLGAGELPEASGLNQLPTEPRGGDPQHGVQGEADSATPTAVTSAPEAGSWNDGSNWPFIGLGYGVVASIAGLGLLYVRGPIF
jgi:energy-coupling factor transport system substrate-specific component